MEALIKKHFIAKNCSPFSEPSASHCRNIKDHCSQIPKTHGIITKRFEIWQKLPECDTETRSETMPLGKWLPIGLLNAGLPQTCNLLKKINKKKKLVSA